MSLDALMCKFDVLWYTTLLRVQILLLKMCGLVEVHGVIMAMTFSLYRNV